MEHNNPPWYIQGILALVCIAILGFAIAAYVS